jgi:hypothetical protein
LSSFRHISASKIDKEVDETDVITLADEQDVIKLRNIRYRRADFSTQDKIYHYIFDQRNLRKIHVKTKGWYVACEKHVCHIDCKDSGGLKCDGKCAMGVH